MSTLDTLMGHLCMSDDGAPTGTAVILSHGRPCQCGPGHCAEAASVGYTGSCRGVRHDIASAPDCPHCGAPHQGPGACWLCSGMDDESAQVWLRCLREGVTGPELFAAQEAAMDRGESPTLHECINVVLRGRA